MLGKNVYGGETFVGCFQIPTATVHDSASCSYHYLNDKTVDLLYRQISAALESLGKQFSSIVAKQHKCKTHCAAVFRVQLQ